MKQVSIPFNDLGTFKAAAEKAGIFFDVLNTKAVEFGTEENYIVEVKDEDHEAALEMIEFAWGNRCRRPV